MRSWDASAILPLCLKGSTSEALAGIVKADPVMIVWWGSVIECWSAFARRRREGLLTAEGEDAARAVLERLRATWNEVQPVEEVRQTAGRLLRTHALRSSDATQLAAAIVSGGGGQSDIIALDQRLREAARLEGLTPRP